MVDWMEAAMYFIGGLVAGFALAALADWVDSRRG